MGGILADLDEVEKVKVRKRLSEVEKSRNRFVAHGDSVVLFHPETKTYLQANARAQRARARAVQDIRTCEQRIAEISGRCAEMEAEAELLKIMTNPRRYGALTAERERLGKVADELRSLEMGSAEKLYYGKRPGGDVGLVPQDVAEGDAEQMHLYEACGVLPITRTRTRTRARARARARTRTLTRRAACCWALGSSRPRG